MSSNLNKSDIAILKLLVKLSRNGEEVYQSRIPEKAKLNPKAVSKVLKRLEKLGFIERAPVIYNKRKTYIIRLNVEAALKALSEVGESYVDIEEIMEEILAIPCITCPHSERCYEGGFYDPVFCPLLLKYVEDKLKTHTQSENRYK
jgi:DNA-binding Lrp family transcriptional regulator